MGSDKNKTLVCVKQVKQEVVDEWDESMPLPGDIVEGFLEDDGDESFVPVKTMSEFRSKLGKVNPQVEFIRLKVRRGDSILKLQARIAQKKGSLLPRKYATIQAATDERHVADLGDLTLEHCTDLQELSRKLVVKLQSIGSSWGFRRHGIKYDWEMKARTHLRDQHCSVISSILFMPLQSEHCIDPTTARCMTWFRAAVSSGVPLEKLDASRKGTDWDEQQNQTLQGIRLWFLPGLEEILIELIPRPGEDRFGMEIKHAEEIHSVMTESAAERGGLRELYEEAIASGFQLVISRLEGISLMPSSVCFDGLIQCCDLTQIKQNLASAIHQIDTIQLHVMAWPNPSPATPSPTQAIGSVALLSPNPNGYFATAHFD
ncbi:hypothetical protein L6164_024462 [Bauhinia variegata]|uniref:Uncharacterized protein n=1 Tax=Bauhinia variegata TaxID=167791 RepID=A0ACB9LXA8_BAUVA|nr:hypothetical protein L6164_024462 [Bauhinia variegata]